MDCAEIWQVDRDPSAMHFAEAKGGVHLHLHICSSFFVSRKHLEMHCPEFWYVGRGAPQAMPASQVMDGVPISTSVDVQSLSISRKGMNTLG